MLKEVFLIKSKSDFNKINILWFLSILSVFFISLVSRYFFQNQVVELSKLFDVEHYLDIAKYGYTEKNQMAFFPFLPIIMAFFNLFNAPVILTVIFNNILTLLSGYLIYNILTDIYQNTNKTGMYGVLLWMFSPIRVYCSIPYTEALLVFFSLLSFYLYKKRSHPFILGITIGLAVFTKSIGSIAFFVIFLFLFIELIKSKDIKKLKYIIKTYIPATIISCLYPIYLQITVGNWKYFIDVQFEHWARASGNIITTLICDTYKLLNSPTLDAFVTILLTFTSLFVAFILITTSFSKEKYKKLDLFILLICSILTIFSTYRNTLAEAHSVSFFRYIYALIPMYLLLNDKMDVTVKKFLTILTFILFTVITFLFLGNNFIT